jgi:hypothetical protein
MNELQGIFSAKSSQDHLRALLILPEVNAYIDQLLDDQLRDIQIYRGLTPTCSAVIADKFLYLIIPEKEPMGSFSLAMALLEVA